MFSSKIIVNFKVYRLTKMIQLEWRSYFLLCLQGRYDPPYEHTCACRGRWHVRPRPFSLFKLLLTSVSFKRSENSSFSNFDTFWQRDFVLVRHSEAPAYRRKRNIPLRLIHEFRIWSLRCLFWWSVDLLISTVTGVNQDSAPPQTASHWAFVFRSWEDACSSGVPVAPAYIAA